MELASSLAQAGRPAVSQAKNYKAHYPLSVNNFFTYIQHGISQPASVLYTSMEIRRILSDDDENIMTLRSSFPSSRKIE